MTSSNDYVIQSRDRLITGFSENLKIDFLGNWKSARNSDVITMTGSQFRYMLYTIIDFFGSGSQSPSPALRGTSIVC